VEVAQVEKAAIQANPQAVIQDLLAHMELSELLITHQT
jgi:hypothetical protein